MAMTKHCPGNCTGAVGISLMRRKGPDPASLTLCDRACLVELMQGNLKRNGVEGHVAAFDWGGDLEALGARVPFDVVLLSDVVTQAYAADHPLLLRSLRDVMHDDSVALMAVELRDQRDKQFFTLLPQHGFAVEHVPNSDLHPEWRAPEIRLFILRKSYGDADTLYDDSGP